jgi:hypothetical protein
VLASQIIDEIFQQELDWSSRRRWWRLWQHVDPGQVSQQRRQPPQGQPREIAIGGPPFDEKSLNVRQVEVPQVYALLIQPLAKVCHVPHVQRQAISE